MSFKQRLSAKEFIVIAEMNTPKGVDISRLVTNARRIKGRVHAALVPDMDNGVMRMSALAGGVLMRQQGLEPIIHVYCRDRNRLALQGDLLAAHVLGIQNLVVVPSEQMEHGDHREAKPVFDLDEVGLLSAVKSLRLGKDLAGFDLDGAPEFTVGCAITSYENEQELAQEVDRAAREVEAGAAFLMSPPVFDVGRFETFAERVKGLGVPVIPTVFLIKSVAVARYIATNEPEAGLGEDLIKRIRGAGDREQECLRIAGETVAALKGKAQGVLIQTTGWEHRLPALLDAAGL